MYCKYVPYIAECFRALNNLSLRASSMNQSTNRRLASVFGGCYWGLLDYTHGNLSLFSWKRHHKSHKISPQTQYWLGMWMCVFAGACVCSCSGGLEVTDKSASRSINNSCRPNSALTINTPGALCCQGGVNSWVDNFTFRQHLGTSEAGGGTISSAPELTFRSHIS